MHAAGVNPVETYIRSGTYARQPKLPYVPGVDSAGVIEHVGADVTKYKVDNVIIHLTAILRDEDLFRLVIGSSQLKPSRAPMLSIALLDLNSCFRCRPT